MKVAVYEELRYFGSSIHEDLVDTQDHKQMLKNAGIEVMKPKKDYTKLKLMIGQYIKIENFVENFMQKNRQFQELNEDRNLFMKHVIELCDVDSKLKVKMYEIKKLYEQMKANPFY